MSYAICTWPTARFAKLGQTIMESCASSLTMSPPVKHFLGVLTRALRRERHFALVEGVPYQPQGSLVIGFRSETQFDPCISSVTTSIMITTSDSPVKGSGIPNQFLGVLLHTIAISGLSRVRTELFRLLVIPSLAQHPEHLDR